MKVQILGEEVDLKENLLKSLRHHRLLWSALVITACVDFFSTLLFMSQYGILVEKNLVVRWLALTSGVVPGVLIGKLLQIAA
ncbi:MAG: hypothetical protein GTO41_16835, partial [Burkholderiales bacterium]|nr:hypothetical protein [Burkholderiales bacterium]